MSYHQIEDIVEDSIRLVNKTTLSKPQKRDLIYNLYQFHDRFDTGYTRFRVLDILQENNYLYAWPIHKHPDYQTHQEYFKQFDEHSTDWIPAYLNNEEKGSIYLEKQKIWFEANDEFWARVKSQLPEGTQTPPGKTPIINLVLELLHIAINQENQLLAKRWYATLVNSILEFELDENEGIPNNFDRWLKNDTLLKIRKTIEENQHILSIKDKPYKNDELLALPKLKDELEFATKPDEKAIVQFLLDIKTSIKTIEKKYRKEIASSKDLTKYQLLYDYFRDKLDSQWQDGIKEIGEEQGIVTFLKKYEAAKSNEEELYNCIIIDYTADIKTVALKIGIQNAQILSWQGRKASSKPEHQHFIQDLFLYLGEEEIDTDKNISDWGGWKYNSKQSANTLTKRLNSIWDCYNKNQSVVNNFYTSPLANWVGIDSNDKLTNEREELLEKNINFFGNEMDFKLFVACINLKNNHQKIAEKQIKEVEELLEHGRGSAQLKNRITRGILYVKEGKGTYPEITTLYSTRLYNT